MSNVKFPVLRRGALKTQATSTAAKPAVPAVVFSDGAVVASYPAQATAGLPYGMIIDSRRLERPGRHHRLLAMAGKNATADMPFPATC